MIRTTINISKAVYQKLLEAAAKQGVSIEEIIIVLMEYFSKKCRSELVTSHAVQYQQSPGDEGYTRVHVNWFVAEYEFLIDLRKVHKKSVSRLISEAVFELLDKIWSYIEKKLDNYNPQPYAIAKFAIHNAIGCIFIWGKPIRSIEY